MARPETAPLRLLAGSREPCRVVAISNIDLSTGGLLTIDGVTLEAGDRVLLIAQTDAVENGIYAASAGAWRRAADGTQSRAVNKGITVHIQEGTAGAGKVYVFQTLNPDVGDDEITIGEYLSETLLTDVQEAADAALAGAQDVLEQIEDVIEQPVQTAVHGATEKATPADNDELALIDSADSNTLKKLLWSSVKTALNSVYAKLSGAQTLTGGFRVTAYSAGTKSTGTFTPDANNGNYQYATNGGAHTLAAPSNDCGIEILYTNNASAGTITFSGFQVGSSTGDSLTTTNGHDFIISIRRINSIATYSIRALQ